MTSKIFLISSLYVFLLSAILGCQTQQKKSLESSENLPVVVREGRLNVQDLKKNKNYVLDVESYLIPSKKMRLEATGPLGVRIASVLVTEDKIQAQLYREKKYLEGIFPRVWERENPTLRVISIPLSPKLLQTIVLGEELPSAQWNCVNQKNGGKECENKFSNNPQLPRKIIWSALKDNNQDILAESENFRLRWSLKSMTRVEAKESMFLLKQNSSYESVDITPR